MYSLLDSCTDFKEYVDLALKNGQKAIATTEHGMHRGYIEDKLYCEEVGMKLLVGVEMYLTEALEPKVRDNYHTILIAKNPKGLRELNRLVYLSSREDHFYYANRISFDEFLGISENIISTSACLASPLSKLQEDHPYYMKLADKYDYLEIQPHVCKEQADHNRRIVQLSRMIGKPIIVGTDTHSSTQYKAECRKVLTEAKGKSYQDDEFDLTYKTYDEIVQMFSEQGAVDEADYLEALENTNRLADSVEDFKLDRSIKYPILYGSKERDAEVFRETVERKFSEKLALGVIPREQEKAFRESIEEEMRVFRKLGMEAFILSMSEIISWCRDNGYEIGTARGSVGGSRVAYVTDIIDLNPEQWQTMFSRFCNEDREEIGDIDIDCIDADRPAIFNHIIEKFGEDKTARVASYGTLQSKAVIDEIGRCLARRWESEAHSGNNPYSIPEIAKVKSELETDEDRCRKNHPDIMYYYDGLKGTIISQSVHPAGMIISPVSLTDTYGVFMKDGERCMLLDMDDAHETGLAKYDLLILKTVTVIRDTCRFIGTSYPKTHEIDWEDKNVWSDMIKSPVALFEFESAFAFDCLKKFKPTSIYDMSLVTACIRPSGTSYRDDVLARKIHKNPSEEIDEILKGGLGRLVYQEDTIKFLQNICGLSGSEADNIRRAIGRKDHERLNKALPSILNGYCSKSKKPREEAEKEAREFLQVIEDSASYQFGYNHSIAYCLLGYLCAYYRYYNPLEFITAFLNNAANEDDIINGAKLAKQKGIKIIDPRFGFSKSGYFFDRTTNTIAKGLSSIKFMSAQAADELYALAHSKTYTSFSDLLIDLKKTSLDSRQLDILIKLDFFSDFGNQRELFTILELADMFKFGEAKQVKRDRIDGTPFEDCVRGFSTYRTKSGAEAKSYTILDVPAVMRACELVVKNAGMQDISLIVKARNYIDIMGHSGFTTGIESDRNKLYVVDVMPVKRKKDGKVFGYSVITQSLGSGKESRMTVFKKVFDSEPIKKGDIIVCKQWERDGQYFRLTRYEHLLT